MLQAVQLVKNQLFLEAIRRMVDTRGDEDASAIINEAIRTLTEVQVRRPDVAAEFLLLPQLSSWAMGFLSRLRGSLGTEWPGTSGPFSSDLGYIGVIAAAAAMRARHPFELRVPLHDGVVSFPAVGTARLDASGWARAYLDDREPVVTSGSCTITVPLDPDQPPGDTNRRWSPVRRLSAYEDGIAIDVGIEVLDPFVKHFGPLVGSLAVNQHSLWQGCLSKAWQVLVRNHRQTARAIARGLTTIVPLAEPPDGRPISATSGWAWGAIALSTPSDPLSLAETLVHEFYHLILGAVEDTVALIAEDDKRLYYAPWRDDPRMLPELLQGCFAHLGVTGFWRRQRNFGPLRARQRSNIEFARRVTSTFETAQTIATATALSESGRIFAVRMRDRLAQWQHEPVPKRAQLIGAELTMEHRVRWRLSHVHPDSHLVDRLARSWLDGTEHPPDLRDPVAITVRPSYQLPAARARLLELRYRDQTQFRRSLYQETALDEADIALLRRDYATARSLYLCRLKSAENRDAWIGLILIRCRTAPPATLRLLLDHPEILVALERRLYALTGVTADPEALIEWLAPRLAAHPSRPLADPLR